MEDCGEIFAIYVPRKYQHQGMGRALMEECLRRLAEYRRAAVWVLKGNEQAIGFYEKCGFRFDGAAADTDIGGPVTELRMILEK